jgi:hypothetical protein
MSKNSVSSYYSNTMKKTNYYLNIGGERVHNYIMGDSTVILPVEFYNVVVGKDNMKWHFVLPLPAAAASSPVASPSPAAASTPPVASPTAPILNAIPFLIPRHIVSDFIDAAIAKNDTCPITLEPFVKETTCMTSCGHLFNREALSRVTGPCPTCRKTFVTG